MSQRGSGSPSEHSDYQNVIQERGLARTVDELQARNNAVRTKMKD